MTSPPPLPPRPPIMPLSGKALSDRIDVLESDFDTYRITQRKDLAQLIDRVQALELEEREVRRRVQTIPDPEELERKARTAALRAVEDTGEHRREVIDHAIQQTTEAMRKEIELRMTQAKLDSVRAKADKDEEQREKSREKNHDRLFEILKIVLAVLIGIVAGQLPHCQFTPAHAKTATPAPIVH